MSDAFQRAAEACIRVAEAVAADLASQGSLARSIEQADCLCEQADGADKVTERLRALVPEQRIKLSATSKDASQ